MAMPGTPPPGQLVRRLEQSRRIHIVGGPGDSAKLTARPATPKTPLGPGTHIIASGDAMRPGRLLFTKLDETASYGPILNEAARTRKPLSFFTNGQRIPEDLESATAPRLLELLLGGGSGRVRAA